MLHSTLFFGLFEDPSSVWRWAADIAERSRCRHHERLINWRVVKGTYVERRDDSYRVTGSRVSLDSVVYAFLGGQTPESIAQSFPVLKLEQVYGAIAFYLAHRDEVDAYLLRAREDYEAQRRAAREADPAFYQKLAEARLREPAGS